MPFHCSSVYISKYISERGGLFDAHFFYLVTKKMGKRETRTFFPSFPTMNKTLWETNIFAIFIEKKGGIL